MDFHIDDEEDERLKEVIMRDREAREREAFKRELSGDIKSIFDNLFRPLKKVKKKKKSWLLKILIWFGALFLALFIVNLILGNIWLFKTIIKSLFFGG